MKRHPMEIRDARPADAAELIGLWERCGRAGDEMPSTLEDAVRAIARIGNSSSERLVVGELDGHVVASMFMRRATITPIHVEEVVHTSFLLVEPEHRRHGYAQALLAEAVSWAEEQDVARVSAMVDSGARDTNRFFARLGLGTVGTLRIAPAGLLRRKLAPVPQTVPAARASRVLAQRRSMRRRTDRGVA